MFSALFYGNVNNKKLIAVFFYYVGQILRIQPDRGRVVAGMNADAAVAFKKLFVKKDLYKTLLVAENSKGRDRAGSQL